MEFSAMNKKGKEIFFSDAQKNFLERDMFKILEDSNNATISVSVMLRGLRNRAWVLSDVILVENIARRLGFDIEKKYTKKGALKSTRITL